jgi:hypothetical protein
MNRIIQVAKRFLNAATTEVPDSFRPDEPALMTLDEYIHHRNPEDKSHSSHAYKATLKSLNRDWAVREIGIQHHTTGVFTKTLQLKQHTGFLEVCAEREGKCRPIAYIKNGILFYDRKEAEKIREDWLQRPKYEKFIIPIKAKKKVKYLGEVRKLIDETATRNLEEYPHIIQRFQNKGEYFEIRSESPLSEGDRQTIVITHDGYIVGMVADEWGATLTKVAEEYQRRGFGSLLGRLYIKNNPTSGSGGMTPAGYNAAVRMWEARVKEFLQRGWYSQLIQENRISKVKVQNILKSLSGKTTPSRLPTLKKEDEKPKVLVLVDDPTFIIYDARFLNDPDEKYVYAYGFFREVDGKVFLYTIDYDRKFQKMAYLIAFQMAKDNNEKVYIGKGYTDFLELENLPEVDIRGDYAELRRDVVNLPYISQLEKKIRTSKDPYQEKKNLLYEMGESKWR